MKSDPTDVLNTMAGEKTKEDRVGSSSPGPGTDTRETVTVEELHVRDVKIYIIMQLLSQFFLFKIDI